eukprot:tig00020610_g12009.t1
MADDDDDGPVTLDPAAEPALPSTLPPAAHEVELADVDAQPVREVVVPGRHECTLCKQQYNLSGQLLLGCSHLVCHTCLSHSILREQDQLAFRSTLLSCPIPQCRRNLSYQEIERAMSAELLANVANTAVPREAVDAEAGTVCALCQETTMKDDLFTEGVCFHSFCKKCTARHIEVQAANYPLYRIPCPGAGCQHVMNLHDAGRVRQHLPPGLFERIERVFMDRYPFLRGPSYAVVRPAPRAQPLAEARPGEQQAPGEQEMLERRERIREERMRQERMRLGLEAEEAEMRAMLEGGPRRYGYGYGHGYGYGAQEGAAREDALRDGPTLAGVPRAARLARGRELRAELDDMREAERELRDAQRTLARASMSLSLRQEAIARTVNLLEAELPAPGVQDQTICPLCRSGRSSMRRACCGAVLCVACAGRQIHRPCICGAHGALEPLTPLPRRPENDAEAPPPLPPLQRRHALMEQLLMEAEQGYREELRAGRAAVRPFVAGKSSAGGRAPVPGFHIGVPPRTGPFARAPGPFAPPAPYWPFGPRGAPPVAAAQPDAEMLPSFVPSASSSSSSSSAPAPAPAATAAGPAQGAAQRARQLAEAARRGVADLHAALQLQAPPAAAAGEHAREGRANPWRGRIMGRPRAVVDLDEEDDLFEEDEEEDVDIMMYRHFAPRARLGRHHHLYDPYGGFPGQAVPGPYGPRQNLRCFQEEFVPGRSRTYDELLDNSLPQQQEAGAAPENGPPQPPGHPQGEAGARAGEPPAAAGPAPAAGPSSSSSQAKCAACGAAGHEGESCEQARQRREQIEANIRANMEFLNRAKRCPECRTPCERISGCNHVRCARCDMHWCYECGRAWGRSDTRGLGGRAPRELHNPDCPAVAGLPAAGGPGNVLRR